MKRYWAYGLTVASEHAFPELVAMPAGEEYDVLVNWYCASSDIHPSAAFTFIMPGIASYAAIDGKQINVYPVSGADEDAVRLYCLSNAFAAILQQRAILPLHCGAFVHEGELVLIAGDSGAGKSTLLLELHDKGYPTFSDDVCVPYWNENNQLAFYSSYPVRKLWQSELVRLTEQNAGARPLRKGMNKFAVPMESFFSTNALVPKAVFFLSASSEVASCSFGEVEGVEKFNRWESVAYRGEFFQAHPVQAEHFRLISELAKTVRAYSAVRSLQHGSVEDLAAGIVSVLTQKKTT